MTAEQTSWIIVISLVALAAALFTVKTVVNMLCVSYYNKKNHVSLRYIGTFGAGIIAIKNIIGNIRMTGKSVDTKDLEQIKLFYKYKFRRCCLNQVSMLFFTVVFVLSGIFIRPNL